MRLKKSFAIRKTINFPFKASKDEEYRPLCDIDDQISCSAVFTSKYARGFGQVSHVKDILALLSKLNLLNPLHN